MIADNIQNALKEKAVYYKVLEFGNAFESTQHAAKMIQIPVEHIAKVLVFHAPFGAIVVIASGTAKVDNQKFKKRFEIRPLMLKPNELKELTGFEPGSVSPIGIASNKVQVYMDITVKQLTDGMVYPSGGTDSSAIEISSADLYTVANCKGIVDVCK